jgi:hypothetical protein
MLAEIGLFIAYGLLLLVALGTIAFSIIDVSRSPNAAVKTLVGLGAFAVILLISYLITGGDGAQRHDDISELRAHITSALLVVLYIIGGLALVGLVTSAIMENFR